MKTTNQLFFAIFAIFAISTFSACTEITINKNGNDQGACNTCPPDDGVGGTVIEPTGSFIGVALADPSTAGTYQATNGFEIIMSSAVFCTESFGNVVVYLTPSQASAVAADHAESGAHFAEVSIVPGQITALNGAVVDVWLIAGNSTESLFGCWSGKRPDTGTTENTMSRADFLDKQQKVDDDADALSKLFKDNSEKKKKNLDTEVSD